MQKIMQLAIAVLLVQCVGCAAGGLPQTADSFAPDVLGFATASEQLAAASRPVGDQLPRMVPGGCLKQ